jgi:hypothetical protein
MANPVIYMRVEVRDTNPALHDPLEIAEAVIDGYEHDLRHGQSGPHIELLDAEWEVL